MNISLDQLKSEVVALDCTIAEHFKKYETDERQLITDGIVNLTDYYNSAIKIMWILKEPYGSGGYSMTEGLNNDRALGKNKDAQSTFHPIIYSTYGILNDFLKYNNNFKIRDQSCMSLILRQIAFVNVQKIPGKTRTPNANLKRYYRTNKEIVLQQIKVYRPDIIIGGKTLHLFKTDLKNLRELEFGHFAMDNQLFINAFHPAQTKITREEYVNKIILRAETWKDIYN